MRRLCLSWIRARGRSPCLGRTLGGSQGGSQSGRSPRLGGHPQGPGLDPDLGSRRPRGGLPGRTRGLSSVLRGPCRLPETQPQALSVRPWGACGHSWGGGNGRGEHGQRLCPGSHRRARTSSQRWGPTAPTPHTRLLTTPCSSSQQDRGPVEEKAAGAALAFTSQSPRGLPPRPSWPGASRAQALPRGGQRPAAPDMPAAAARARHQAPRSDPVTLSR